MSGPVSLRLCCLAAMAPALTEATGHSRLDLKGGSSALCNNNTTTETAGVKHKGIVTAIASDSIASVKLKAPVPSLVARQRGFLQPIHQGNGTSKSFTSESKSDNATDSLTDLQIIKNLPDILKQLSSSNVHLGYTSDHHYPKNCEKKMNQPSNGNGLNGTGKYYVKQTILTEGNKLNGHTKKNVTELNISKNLNCGVPGPGYVNNRNLHHLSSSVKPLEMGHTSDKSSKCGTKPLLADPSTSRNIPSTCVINKHTVPTHVMDSNSRNSEAVSCPEPGTADLIKDATRKEFLLERRSQFLMRRLRRIQGKQLETGVHDQLKSFAEFQHQNLQTVASRAIRPFGDLQSTLFNSSDVKNLSTSNLVSLVRKLQSSQQKAAALNPKKIAAEIKGVLVMEQGVSAESDRKSCQLKTNVGHWNAVVDADATESSSGGESCEEWEDCPVMEDKKIPVPLYKRAEWKWAVDRAAIISRWTWLQAQVSDLEYRIRQQKEIYKTIRTSKGVVTLGNMPVFVGKFGDVHSERKQQESPANVTTLMINVNNQASKLSKSLGNCLSPVQPQGIISDKTKDMSTPKFLNGYVDGSHITSTPQSQGMSRMPCGLPSTSVGPSGDSASLTFSPDLNQPLDVNCVSARCRPVRFYRKRKLLRTAGLHQVNHKAARLSTVKCQCFPPTEYCPLCGGRYNNVQKLDAEGMAVMEKVALLDQAYHPVLSFPQEIALPIHFEALLKSGEWQTAKPPPKATLRALAAEKRRQKILNAQLKDQARKNRKKLTKSAAAILLTSAKLRSKYEGKSPHHSPKKKIIAEKRLRRKELKRRRAAQLAAAAHRKNGFGPYHDTDLDSLSTQTPSPIGRDNLLSLSGQSGSLKEAKELAMRKKRFENAYDINNIVIPYSMAAATRVEKLQYKEIQTPKWRELSLENNEEPMEVNETTPIEVEDASDEAFSTRHFSLEEEERKRFRSYISYPVRRSRHSRESESQSSDCHPIDSLMTEYNVDMDGQHAVMHYSASAFSREEGRRRSGSTSYRMPSQDDCLMDFEISRMVFEPWENREFPLSEDCFEEMQREQISARSARRPNYTRARVVKLHDTEDMEFVNQTRPESPTVPASPSQSYSSGSTLDDLNDPEWHGERRKDRRPSGGIKHPRR